MTKEEKKYLAKLDKFRKKHVPERYNQIELLDHLLDEDLDHYISISNRSDGKSFNYIHAIVDICIEHGLGFTLIARHFTVRYSYQEFLMKVFDKSKKYNAKDFQFFRTNFYIQVIYRDRTIGVITDLNQATDLKYLSNFLEDFPIIVYDEFLALEGDYLPDEWDRLRTIYSSINRKDESDVPLIKFPKVIYLGNAVNFSSPVLASLELFNILEKHPIGTKRKYGNVILEMHRNNNANDYRNLRAFKEESDNLTHGEFKVNNFNVITENTRVQLNKNARNIIVKLRDNYLKITFNLDNKIKLLSIIGYSEHYDFNLLLKDNKENSVFLDESYFDEDHARKYVKKYYYFDNTFSKDFITDGIYELSHLKINKVISKYLRMNRHKTNFEIKEAQYKDNYVEQTKKALARQFLL